jgi:hypothetical protein
MAVLAHIETRSLALPLENGRIQQIEYRSLRQHVVSGMEAILPTVAEMHQIRADDLFIKGFFEPEGTIPETLVDRLYIERDARYLATLAIETEDQYALGRVPGLTVEDPPVLAAFGRITASPDVAQAVVISDLHRRFDRPETEEQLPEAILGGVVDSLLGAAGAFDTTIVRIECPDGEPKTSQRETFEALGFDEGLPGRQRIGTVVLSQWEFHGPSPAEVQANLRALPSYLWLGSQSLSQSIKNST